ncbi:MAG: hypothetical protein WD844_02815 [Thermoleophilaceae bacterium]
MTGSSDTGFLPPASSEAAAVSRRERVRLALRTVSERRRLVLGTAVVACVATLLVSLAQEDEYEATSALLVSQPETILGGAAPVDAERLVRTSLELIELESVAERVRRSLRVRDRTLTTGELLDRVEAEVRRDSDVIEIRARDRDAQVAADIANSFAARYVDFRRDTARSSIEEAIERAERQLEDLEEAGGSASIRRGIERRLRDLELSAAQQGGNVDVVERASLPGDPVSPRPAFATLIALPAGLLLGLALAGLVSLLDRRIRREEQVEALTGLPVVTAVPRRPVAPARRKGNGVWADPAEAEAYNRLATNLRFFNFDRSVSTVLVASAVPREGKTTVTLRLAAALAGAGQGVLAIEADMRRPTFSDHFSIQFPHGLSGVLAGATPFDDVVTRVHTSYALAAPVGDDGDEAWTAAPFIEVVPAGLTPPNPAELLASNALAGVLRQAQARADVVLIDSAPLVPVGDAVSLASAVDGVLLVVRLGVSRRDEVRRALRLLGTLRSRVVGVVVTNAERGDERYGYYGARPAPPATPDALGPRRRPSSARRRRAPRYEENGGDTQDTQDTQESEALDPRGDERT